MEIKHTIDSPILLKLIPETIEETFKNGERSASLKRMDIPHRVDDDGAIILNIDPTWKDFAEDREEDKTWV